MTHPLVVALEARRQAERWSHERMAVELEVSRQLWIRTKTGHLPLGKSVRLGAARRFAGEELGEMALQQTEGADVSAAS